MYAKQLFVLSTGRRCVWMVQKQFICPCQKENEIMLLICGIGKVGSGRPEDDYRHFWLGVVVFVIWSMQSWSCQRVMECCLSPLAR
jgi:hypothetical protein